MVIGIRRSHMNAMSAARDSAHGLALTFQALRVGQGEGTSRLGAGDFVASLLTGAKTNRRHKVAPSEKVGDGERRVASP
jgi:hypothetical protein